MPGVIYIQSVPPMFTVKRLREIMCRHGELGRIYLQAEKRGPQRRKRYTEGWVEYKSKKVAKEVARLLNGQLVGGRRRSAAYDSIWTMKYLQGFKWEHLMDQLHYEQRIEQQRLRTEIVQEKRKAEFFSQQVEKGERLKQLEEKILKKCGLWEHYQRQHQQRKVVQEKSRALNESETFLRQIFGTKNDEEEEDREKEDESEVREAEEVEDDENEERGAPKSKRRRKAKSRKNSGSEP